MIKIHILDLKLRLWLHEFKLFEYQIRYLQIQQNKLFQTELYNKYDI